MNREYAATITNTANERGNSGVIWLELSRGPQLALGQVQGRGVRHRRVILRRNVHAVNAAGGVLLFCRGVVDGARFAQDVEGRGGAGFGPFVLLFGQYGTDETDERVAVGDMPRTTSVRRRISLLRRSWGLLGQIWRQITLGNTVNAMGSARAASRWSVVLRSLSASASMIRSYLAATGCAPG